MDTISKQALAGKRVPVHSNGGISGFVFVSGYKFMFEATSGLGEGCIEPICFVESDYLDKNYREA